MSGSLLRPGLAFLRILIFAGALASIVQPRVAPRLTHLTWVTGNEWSPRAFALDMRSLVRLALTAVSLALL